MPAAGERTNGCSTFRRVPRLPWSRLRGDAAAENADRRNVVELTAFGGRPHTRRDFERGRAPLVDQAVRRRRRATTSRLPARSAPSRRHAHGLDIEAAAGEEPRDQGIGVPHLSRSALVATPDERRHGGYEIEEALRRERVSCQSPWAFDRFTDIRDHAVAPATDLVTKDPEASGPAASDRALDYDASRCTRCRRGPAPARSRTGLPARDTMSAEW